MIKQLINRIPEERRGLAFAMLCAIPIAGMIANCDGNPQKVAVDRAESERIALIRQQAAQEDAENQKWMHAGNNARGECARAGRQYVTNPRSYRNQDAWINGDIKSDFVVIAPFTAENAFGQPRKNTMICYGNAGVITRYEVD
jgi:hypothetical protein